MASQQQERQAQEQLQLAMQEPCVSVFEARVLQLREEHAKVMQRVAELACEQLQAAHLKVCARNARMRERCHQNAAALPPQRSQWVHVHRALHAANVVPHTRASHTQELASKTRELTSLTTERANLKLDVLTWRKQLTIQSLKQASADESAQIWEHNAKVLAKQLVACLEEQEQLAAQVAWMQAQQEKQAATLEGELATQHVSFRRHAPSTPPPPWPVPCAVT